MTKYTNSGSIPFPTAVERNLYQGKRKLREIPGYKAIVNMGDDSTYTIVTNRYVLVQHPEVIAMMDRFCTEVPGLNVNGNVNKEVWLDNNGGRMKVKYTFPDITHEIRPGDAVALTLEAFASFDTSLAQRLFFGFYRLICSNGAKIGKIISEYKRKHTTGIDLDEAYRVVLTGLENFPAAMAQLRSFASRDAFLSEINLYEAMPLQKGEKLAIESEIKRQGKVITWDDEEIKNRDVKINAWDMYNILTKEITHGVTDITRQQRLFDSVADTFNR